MKMTNLVTKRILSIACAAVLLAGTPLVSLSADAASTIKRVGNQKKSVITGQEFELKVSKAKGVRDNDLKWTIANTSIVAYDDNDRYDDDMDFKAKKAGTTKITCKNTKNGNTVTFQITVKSTSKKNTISSSGAKTRSIKVGQELELKVKKLNGAKERNLKWTVSDTSIVAFADKDRYGDDMDFRAKKAGTTKITCKDTSTGDKVTYTVTVKKPSSTDTISRVGNQSRTYRVNREFDLEVNTYNGAKERNLKWSISNTSVVAFDDDDRYGDDMEFRAKKAGTATITCKDVSNGDTVTYKITVK